MVQSTKMTLDEASRLLDSLLTDMKYLRENWPLILREAKVVATNIGFESMFAQNRQKQRKKHPIVNQEDYYRVSVFYVAMDAIFGQILSRFKTIQIIANQFSFIWDSSNEDTIVRKANELAQLYPNDVNAESTL